MLFSAMHEDHPGFQCRKHSGRFGNQLGFDFISCVFHFCVTNRTYLWYLTLFSLLLAVGKSLFKFVRVLTFLF